MRDPLRRLAAIAAFSLATLVAAHADEPSTPGALRVTDPKGTLVDMPLQHTKVSIEVTAFVARTTVEQVFVNPFDTPIEAVYTFPLGDRAAVDDFELTVGSRTIKGEIKRREEARAAYDAARAAGYQAALLDQERPNIFTQSVANLEPRKPVTVRLRTVETLTYERGIYRLAFPLVVGPRYVPGGGRVADAARVTPPPLLPGTRSGHDVEISVTIDAGVPLRDLVSPSHRISTKRVGSGGAAVELADADTIPNKDFQLRWSVSSERPAVGFLAHRDGLDGFFTLLVQPKGEINALEAMPKEITLVVDTSGSMSGIPLAASQRFIAKALKELGPRDTFNVIRFAGDNTIFSKTPLANTPSEVERAIAWVNALQGGGGTEVLAAMRAAFALPPDPNRLRVVIFLTDGYVGNEPEILGSIREVLGDARIYTVGIGSSVNRYLLDRMAGLGRGAFIAIRPDEAADDALEAFKSWVTKPYLTDLTVDWGALPIADVSPERIGDLGSGQTLTITGRYLRGASDDIVVRGRLGGRYWEQRVRVSLPEREIEHAALASVWARARIEELMLADPNAIPDSVRAEVTSLALSYRLMSPYTSFVAVDDSVVINPGGQGPTLQQALPVPEGVSFGGVFGGAELARLKKEKDEQPEHVERVTVVGEKTHVDLDQSRAAMKIPSEFVNSPPVARRARQNAVAPRPASPASGRDFKTSVSGISGQLLSLGYIGQSEPDPRAALQEHLRDRAFRVLADLADDGKLSDAEGRPALAALLAAQTASGGISADASTHAVAAWALDEATQALPTDSSVATARTKAIDYLTGLNASAIDAESRRWMRLVLGFVRPSAVAEVPVPDGEPSAEYKRLRDAIASARTRTPVAAAKGHTAFDRLVDAISRGKLI